MYEQHLILIQLPLNALTLLTTGEIVGGEWMGVGMWTDHAGIILKEENK